VTFKFEFEAFNKKLSLDYHHNRYQVCFNVLLPNFKTLCQEYKMFMLKYIGDVFNS